MPGLEAQATYTQLAQAVKELHTLPVHLDQHGRHMYSHATQRWTCRRELLSGATHLKWTTVRARSVKLSDRQHRLTASASYFMAFGT